MNTELILGIAAPLALLGVVAFVGWFWRGTSMSAVYATVLSGFAVSSSVLLFPSDRKWAVQVPSMTGNTVRIEFASSSGANDFAPLAMRPDLIDVVNSSAVRPAWGWFYP